MGQGPHPPLLPRLINGDSITIPVRTKSILVSVLVAGNPHRYRLKQVFLPSLAENVLGLLKMNFDLLVLCKLTTNSLIIATYLQLYGHIMLNF